MLGVELLGARARVRGWFSGRGSVRAETVTTRCEGVECELLIESDETPETIAKLVRLSEAGCFVIQSLRQPSEVRLEAKLNERRLDRDLGAEPRLS